MSVDDRFKEKGKLDFRSWMNLRYNSLSKQLDSLDLFMKESPSLPHTVKMI